MQYNSNNPLIPHASTSLEKDQYRMQSMINAIARKIIRKDAKTHHTHKTYYIKDHAIIIQ